MATLQFPENAAEFHRLVPDEATAEAIFALMRWPDGPCCLRCGSHDVTKLSTRKVWQCNIGECRAQTSIRSGTALARTRKPLRDWVYTIWSSAFPEGVSTRSIAGDLDCRYDTVFVMVHKLRATLADRGGWQVAGPAALATSPMPVGKHAKGDPEDRPPVAVAIAAATEPAAPQVDIVRFAVAPLEETDADLLARARYEHIEPGAEVKVERERLSPFRRVARELKDADRRVRRRLGKVHRGVSRKYTPNYLAHAAYFDNRGHTPASLFEWMIRRVMTEPWRGRAELALSSP